MTLTKDEEMFVKELMEVAVRFMVSTPTGLLEVAMRNMIADDVMNLKNEIDRRRDDIR